MEEAYTTCGFAVFTNVYDSWLSEFSDWQHLMDECFKQSSEPKNKYSYNGVADNLGYSGFTTERLAPNKPGDLKESFNWVSPDRMKEQFWPTEIPEFKPLAQKILRIAQLLSFDFLYKFENILSLPKGKLVEQHIDAASMIRIIKYPSHNDEITQSQLRGNEHTDYGSITLAFMYFGYKWLDYLTPFDTGEELKNGNRAVGQVVGSIFIGIGVAIGLVIGLG